MMGRVHLPSSSRLLLSAVLVAAFGLGAAGAWGQTCGVTSTADTNTAGTLRYCLSNLVTGTAVGTNTVTITATGTITLTSALPAINQGVTITGPGANQLTIDGGGAYQVFAIGTSAITSASISGLTVANGKASTTGGAIDVVSGTLMVTGCAFTNNSATSSTTSSGGAIFASGALTVSGSTFSGNTASYDGGAIYNATGPTTVTGSTFSGNSALYGGAINGYGAAMTVTDSTFSGNSATEGGAILAAAASTITNNTFFGNSASSGGAIYFLSATQAADNNLFSSNKAKTVGAAIDQASGTVNADHNVYYQNLTGSTEDDCAGCTGNTNATSASSNPLALPLGNYGGPTETFLPEPGSAAICVGSATLATAAGVTADQRGFLLTSGSPCSSSAAVDAGAVQTNYIQVQASSATNPSCPGNKCTLPTAITSVNTTGYGDIDFATSVTSITVSSKLELSGKTGINIIGPGAKSLTISGGSGAFSVFVVDAQVPAALYGMTISGGNPAGSGGGINNSGNLTLLSSAVSGNTAPDGGGIENSSGGTALLVDDTISGNNATSGAGGGIDNPGTMEIEESTVFGNSASASSGGANGGGISSNGSLMVVNSTIAGNSVSGSNAAGGGIYSAGGSASLSNTIVSGNTAGTSSGGANSNIDGTYTGTGNVIGGNTDTTNNQTSTGALITLSPLGYSPSSASLKTQIPLPGIAAGATSSTPPGNPAICGGLSANVPSNITTDERGLPISPNDCPSGAVDAGAVQTNYTMSFTTNPPSTVTVDQGFAAAVTLDESGTAFSAGSVNIPLTLNGGTLYGTTTEATSAGVASYAGLTATAGNGLTLGAALPLNAALTPSLSISAASAAFDVNQAATSVTVTASSSNPTSPVVNNALTFIATISPQNPPVPYDATNGTVTFSDTTTNTVLCFQTAISVTSGVASASCTTTALDAASHTISAVYNGDGNYLATTSKNVTTLSVTVGKAPTSVVVSGPSNGAFGSSITFSAAVTPLNSSVPFSSTGTVTFTDTTNSTTLCSAATITPSTGIATCSTSSLAQGSATISAVYNGDSNYLKTTSANVTTTAVLVGKANPTGSLACTSNDPNSPNCATSIALNSTETFTETVTGPNGATAPTGKVTFTDNGSSISGCGGASGVTLQSGAASCQANLSGGSHSVVATYLGDTNYNSVTNSVNVHVGSGGTTTTFTSPTTWTSTVNAAVAFSVQVSPQTTGGPAPTGTVTITENNTAISGCSGPINSSGVFSCSTQALPLGQDSIQANYTSGDTNYSGSSSQKETLTVSQGSSSTSLSSSNNPSVVNSTVTFNATVTVPSGPTAPSGTVTFTDGGNAISQACTKVALTVSQGTNSGTAQCDDSSLTTVGSHNIQATYANDSNFTNSSNSLTQNVQTTATTTTITASPTGPTVNQLVTLNVTVKVPLGSPNLTGTVSVIDNGQPVAGCQNLALSISTSSTSIIGAGTCSTSSLPAGANTLVAEYANDASNGTSSGSVTVQVGQASSQTALTSSMSPSVVNNPKGYNDSVTFTATVTSANISVAPTGTVLFTENGLAIPECPTAVPVALVGSNYEATCTTTSLPAGADTILAVYGSDPNYATSSSFISQSVQDYSLVVSSTPPVVITQGYTTSNDLFSPQTISVVPISAQGFATQSGAPLSLMCMVTTIFSPVSQPTTPLCSLALASLPVNGSGAQSAIVMVIDGTSASAGIFSVQVNGTDPTTGLSRSSAPFTVTVRAASAPLTVVSGATTGNSGSLSFLLPGGVSLTNLACESVSGPNLTGSVSPASLGISCSFNPTSITNSGTSMQTMQVAVTVDTGNSSTTTTAAVSRDTNLWLGGLLGLPLFGLMGLIRGRKSPRSVFFRLIAIVVICFAAFQVMGCGGSFATQPTNSGGGKTPPGVYKVLVVGTGSDGQIYEAVLQLNVQL